MAVISAGAADNLQVSDLVLAARALDVTVGAQKSASGEREPNGLKRRENN